MRRKKKETTWNERIKNRGRVKEPEIQRQKGEIQPGKSIYKNYFINNK